jgi:hypothetical protein
MRERRIARGAQGEPGRLSRARRLGCRRPGAQGLGGPAAPALHGLRRRDGEVERDEVVERAQAERLDKVAVRAGLDRAALVRVEALP